MASTLHGSKVQWLAGALAVVLVAAGYALAVAASSAPQCCDAIAYQEEARTIVGGEPQLLWVHNYAYAAFLALLHVVGLAERLGVALAQTTLLYAAVLATAVSISRSTHASVSVAMVPLAAVALVPASAWSGYTLSEGLAAPVLLLVFGLVISHHVPRPARHREPGPGHLGPGGGTRSVERDGLDDPTGAPLDPASDGLDRARPGHDRRMAA